ncbi:MAG: hypothetical protein HDR88_09375 [Bacteroides sp.]|nr:hypothetical protein [Bacteroides sp.]
MDSKEKNFKDNGSVNADMIANSMKAQGRERHRENTRKINRLWLWLGVLVLIAILLYWLFSIGMFESLSGVANG